MEIGLKPCPFCGQDPELRREPVVVPEWAGHAASMGVHWYIQCRADGHLATSAVMQSISDAAAAWNMRVEAHNTEVEE